MPDGIQGLADFTLILQNIARVDINSTSLQYIRPTPSEFVFQTSLVDDVPPEMRETVCCTLPEYVLPPMAVKAQVFVDPCGNLVPDRPAYRPRVENLGSDSYIRSQINAAGLH